MIATLSLLAFLPLAPQSQEDETDAHGYDKVRIEQEDKLLVPSERVGEVWEFLRTRFHDDPTFLAGLGPEFTSRWSEELFHDTYFDTPTMQLYAIKSGVRHRTRENLTNPDDVKSGRELMQIKLNDISGNELERAEIKYEIDMSPQGGSPEDGHPMLGRVKEKHREDFKRRLTGLGLDPQVMQPILTVKDIRRRIYFMKDGKPFMSISHDQASCWLWWGLVDFCEIEPELNEIGFTEADAATREYMETVLARVVGEILAKFPDIQRDLTPKYNKAFDRLETRIPFLRAAVGQGLQDEGMTLLALAVALGGVAGFTVRRAVLRKRADRRFSGGGEARKSPKSPQLAARR